MNNFKKINNVACYDKMTGSYATENFLYIDSKEIACSEIYEIRSIDEYIVTLDRNNYLCIWKDGELDEKYNGKFKFIEEGFVIKYTDEDDDDSFKNIFDYLNNRMILKNDIKEYSLSYKAKNDNNEEVIIGYKIGVDNNIVSFNKDSEILWKNDITDFIREYEDISDFIGIIKNKIWIKTCLSSLIVLSADTGKLIKEFHNIHYGYESLKNDDDDFIYSISEDFFAKINTQTLQIEENYRFIDDKIKGYSISDCKIQKEDYFTFLAEKSDELYRYSGLYNYKEKKTVWLKEIVPYSKPQDEQEHRQLISSEINEGKLYIEEWVTNDYADLHIFDANKLVENIDIFDNDNLNENIDILDNDILNDNIDVLVNDILNDNIDIFNSNKRLEELVMLGIDWGIYLRHDMTEQIAPFIYLRNGDEQYLRMLMTDGDPLEYAKTVLELEKKPFQQFIIGFEGYLKDENNKKINSIIVYGFDISQNKGVSLGQMFLPKENGKFKKIDNVTFLGTPDLILPIKKIDNPDYSVAEIGFNAMSISDENDLITYVAIISTDNSTVLANTIRTFIRDKFTLNEERFSGQIMFIITDSKDEEFLTFLVTNAINEESESELILDWINQTKKEIILTCKIGQETIFEKKISDQIY